MEKTFNPQAIETKWYAFWEENNYFQPSQSGPAYCMMLPPPNITGSLHMGHGFQHTLMDAVIRYHRMLGENVLWQGGTDHASIATQWVVERRLLAQGTTREALGREKFLEQVWKWKGESGGQITQQMRRMGDSISWSRERFTMDDDFAIAVNKAFVELYREGLIYRGKKLVNWDPQLATAISDLEVIATEEQGSLWYIRYPYADLSGYVVIATTRPETLLGDAAVAVHPSDERYQSLIGQSLRLPLTDRCIKIIADEAVDPAFGTGCVKITPAHDFNDYATGQRHQLPLINVFTKDAHLNENAPAAYRGLDRFVARKKILEDLKQSNLIEKVEPHWLSIPRGEKTGAVIEPYLTDQWFMKMKALAEPAIAAVQDQKIKFYPENWTKTYFQWLTHIEDWCISRQLWWGHRIPAWYDSQHQVYVGATEQEVRQQYHLPADVSLQQETDILDTWFSAALWPFATLGWPKQTDELRTFYPTNMLVTGFDILFFWVARMVMLSLKFTQQVPFKAVYITGLIRDQHGQKMSKTKGNVLDPIDLMDGITLDELIAKRVNASMTPAQQKGIEQLTRQEFPEGIPAFGTDALRFTYCALATPTRDIRFERSRIESYRHFCNKLWNAARFALLYADNDLSDRASAPDLEGSMVDRWISSQLQKTVQAVRQHFEDCRFDWIAQTLYSFVWNEYCDWYIELVKPELSHDQTGSVRTYQTLVDILEASLRLLHPIMPFITEEIWQSIAPLAGKSGATIMQQPYPSFDEQKIDTQADEEIIWLKTMIVAIRTVRSETGIPPNQKISLLCHKGHSTDRLRIERYQTYIKQLAKIDSITWLAEGEAEPVTAMGLVGELKFFIPLQHVTDMAGEIARIEKKIGKLNEQLQKAENKLKDEHFVKHAPENIVQQERDRLAQLSADVDKLRQQLEALEAYL